jgi:hypothetical protein
MLDRLLEGPTVAERLLWGAGFFALSSALSLVAVTAVLVALPARHFREAEASAPWPSAPLLRAAWRIGKNLLGLALVALGLLLSLPGIPGQGLLTMLIGLILLDLPPASGASSGGSSLGPARRAQRRGAAPGGEKGPDARRRPTAAREGVLSVR